MTVNLHALSRLTGHTVHLIQKHIAEGFEPDVVGDLSRRYEVSVPKYLEWFIDYRERETDSKAVEFKVARTERMNADAERMEKESAALAAQTFTVEDAETVIAELNEQERECLRRYPAVLKEALAKMPPDERADAYHITTVLQDTAWAVIAETRVTICGDDVEAKDDDDET